MIDPLLNAYEVAEILRIAAKTVLKLVRDGELQSVRVNGRDRRFTSQHVQEYIERRTTHLAVDVKPQRRVSCKTKGEEKSKFVGAIGRDLLREEIKQLCR